MKWNAPNVISLTRIIIAPIFFIMIINEDRAIVASACILFLLGALTDYFDGLIARKYQIITSEGTFFDPLADKMLTSAAFLAFVKLDIVPFWMVLIIIIRDFGTTFMRLWTKKNNLKMTTSLSAKWKTTLQMFLIATILVFIFLKNTGLIDYKLADKVIYSNITFILMLILTLFTLWTAIDYIISIKKEILNKKVLDKSRE